MSTDDGNNENTNTRKTNASFMNKCTNAVNGFLENVFSRCGLLVGTHPIKTIIISLIFAMICLVGLVEHAEESRGEKLWVEQSSQYVEDQNYARNKFPTRVRYISMLLKGGDVLTKDGLLALLEIDKLVKNIYKNSTDRNWDQMHYKTPTLSLLEFWNFNETVISRLSKDEILSVVNTSPLVSPTRNINVSLSNYVSDVSGNATHAVVQAGVAALTYYIKFEVVVQGGKWLDEHGTAWELEFAKVFKQKSFSEWTTYYSTLESFRQAGLDAIGNDYGLLFTGYALIITYVAVMLGRFSRLQHKFWLAIVGILCVGLSIAIAMGLCAAAQVIYGPVHSILPFLMLGIGVDDVFVIIQTWENVAGPITDQESIPMKVSRTMRHAGVAITVTSFTDICAFLIGATTVLPALRSFCIYVGIGILMLYIYVSTFFVAFLTIDANRQRNNRDACCGMKLPSDWSALACSTKSYLQIALSKFIQCIITMPGKLIVVVLTGVLLAFGVYGLLQLNQNFDPDWFLPRDSDEIKYRQSYREYFPSHGAKSAVYIGDVDYFKEQRKFHELYDKVRNNYAIQTTSVSSWYDHFIKDVSADAVKSSVVDNNIITNETLFYKYLGEFLSTTGKPYRSNVNHRETEDGVLVKASRFTMTHVNIKETKEQIKAMDSIRDAASSTVFASGSPKTSFAFSEEYIRWQTNRIIGEELVRNLILAGVCVFLVTLFLIANFFTSFLVLCCVAFSLIDICGFMYYWDLSIDMIISTILVVALGFAVDYSGHIGHAFMASREGNRNERARSAVTKIGPAVLNGGISTFLAFCLLAGSESYAFQTFFKVFFLVVSIGLFHGLVFLPVLLSIIGPKAYNAVDETIQPVVKCSPKTEAAAIEMKKNPPEESDSMGEKIDKLPKDENGIYNISYIVS